MGLQNSPLLEMAIGIVFLYLIFGLICTAINELVAQMFNMRAETLWAAVRSLLYDPEGTGIAAALYNQPLIHSLATRDINKEDETDPHLRPKPSYIPSHVFSLALMDLLTPKPTPAVSAGEQSNAGDKPPVATTSPTVQIVLDNLRDLSTEVMPVKLKQALAELIQAAEGDMNQARINIERWYEDAMDRASGWYKRKVQWIILFIAFLIVFINNADSLSITDRLWKNPVERTQIVNAAQSPPLASPQANPGNKTSPLKPAAGATSGKSVPAPDTNAAPGASSSSDTTTSNTPPEPGTNTTAIPQIPQAMESLLGWSGPFNPADKTYNPTDPRRFPNGFIEWLLKLIGLLLTAVAASLGAPFWFDILNKFINIRAAGSSPDEVPRRPRQSKERIPSGKPPASDNQNKAAT